MAADGIEVLQILKTLWRRRLVIALVTLALTVIGYWFINRITPRYAAETVLLLDVSAADSTNEVDEIVNGLSKDEALINSQIDIMSSRNIAERVVDPLLIDVVSGIPDGDGADCISDVRSAITSGLPATLGSRTV